MTSRFALEHRSGGSLRSRWSIPHELKTAIPRGLWYRHAALRRSGLLYQGRQAGDVKVDVKGRPAPAARSDGAG